MNIYEHEVGLIINPTIKEFLNCHVNINVVKLTDPDKTIMTLNDWVVDDVTDAGVSVIYHDDHDNNVYCVGFNKVNLSPNNDVIVFITKCDGSTPVEVFSSEVTENIIINTHIQPITCGKLSVNHDIICSDFHVVIEERTNQRIKFKYHDYRDGELRSITGVIQLVNYHNEMKFQFIEDDTMNNNSYFVNLSDITFRMM